MRTLHRTDTGALAFRRVDGHGEVGFVLGAVVAHHQGQLQLTRAFLGDGHTNQAAGLTGEKRNDFRVFRVDRFKTIEETAEFFQNGPGRTYVDYLAQLNLGSE